MLQYTNRALLREFTALERICTAMQTVTVKRPELTKHVAPTDCDACYEAELILTNRFVAHVTANRTAERRLTADAAWISAASTYQLRPTPHCGNNSFIQDSYENDVDN